jgi:hypothetical protein
MSTLSIWTIYDHPKDFPHWFVARKHVANGGGATATSETILAHDIEALRVEMQRRGLIPFLRDPSDDPVIVESWL